MKARPKNPTAMGLAWYRASEWEEVKAFCDDRDNFEDSYEAWKRSAEKARRKLEREGFHIEGIDFDLQEFKDWCLVNRKPSTGASRSEFTLFKLRELHGTIGK